MQPSILIATCDELTHPTPNADRLLRALRSRGVSADHHAWRGTDVKTFARADAVLPLCFWDPYRSVAQFLPWIDAVLAAGGRLINPPSLLRWNFRKTYLVDLFEAGLPVPPTVHLTDVTTPNVERAMKDAAWEHAVLKPVTGQDGHGVRKLHVDRVANWALPPMAEGLLQPFQSDITTFGETTLTYFDGEFSHAVKRTPRPGEWRANRQFGVEVEMTTVAPQVVIQAAQLLAHLPEVPLYARVDGIVRPDGFALMEMELIDPYLYLEFVPSQAAARLATSLLKRISTAHRPSPS